MTIKTVEAPLPGTFFRRPAPDQPPFKGEGDNVAVGDTVGLIEVMKTFTPVAAEAGRLVASTSRTKTRSWPASRSMTRGLSADGDHGRCSSPTGAKSPSASSARRRRLASRPFRR